MSQERLEPRPETSKCSRLDKRRMASQNQCRTKVQVQNRTSQNFYQSNYNGITLEQYFRTKAAETPVKKEQPLAKPNKKLLVTSNDFFNQKEYQHQDLMRRTFVAESKYVNIKEDYSKRFQNQEKELFDKYAHKFDLIPGKTKEQIDQMYSKIK